MPRRRPGDLRVSGAVCTSHDPAVHHVHGVPARVLIAIREVEHRTLRPGAVREALGVWRHLARQGLYTQPWQCECCKEEHPRDVLEEAVSRLPPWAKRDLRRLVRQVDRVYLARTWPDPDAPNMLPG